MSDHRQSIELKPSFGDIRAALASVTEFLAGLGVSQDARETVELVLAEVLTNVVKHACEGTDCDRIVLDVLCTSDTLECDIRDSGRAMPGMALPTGQAQDVDVATEDLPEGGFGWFLIRQLATDLNYRRVNDENCLGFNLPISFDAARH